MPTNTRLIQGIANPRFKASGLQIRWNRVPIGPMAVGLFNSIYYNANYLILSYENKTPNTHMYNFMHFIFIALTHGLVH